MLKNISIIFVINSLCFFALYPGHDDQLAHWTEIKETNAVIAKFYKLCGEEKNCVKQKLEEEINNTLSKPQSATGVRLHILRTEFSKIDPKKA